MSAALKQHHLPAERESRIRSALPLVRRLALRRAGLLPASVDVDDLIGAGMLGLIDAADRFDEARGIPFECYARTRVEGAMIDALRAGDHLTRKDRREQREAGKAELKLRSKLHREPTHDELDRARGGVREAISHAGAFVSLEEWHEPTVADDRSPFHSVSTEETNQLLRAAVAELDERDQVILSLYYEKELTYREIGEVLGVTESRICQILRSVQKELRAALEGRV